MDGGKVTPIALGVVGGGGLLTILSNPGQTLHSIEWAWTFLLRVVESGPLSIKALVLAVLAGWLVHLRVSMLPIRCMSVVGMSMLAQLASTFASFLVIYALWREPMGLIVGALVALSTPYTWAAFLIILELCPCEWSRRWAAELRGEGGSLAMFWRNRRDYLSTRREHRNRPRRTKNVR